MEQSLFYLTLSSDSPCEFKQENNASKFRVHLGQVIELLGKWEVALFEIFYPATLCNVKKETCFVTKQYSVDAKEFKNVLVCGNEFQDECELFSEGKILVKNMNDDFFHSTQEFINSFNDQMQGLVSLDYLKNIERVKIVIEPLSQETYEKVHYKLSDQLSDILGFPRDKILHPGKNYTSQLSCDLRKGLPHILTVCTDLIADQIVNNYHSKALRSFPITPKNYEYGFHSEFLFTKLVFLPVIKKQIEFVDLYIKDEFERLASFRSGVLKVVLLLRRVGNE